MINTTPISTADTPPQDPVSTALKWILLITAILCFIALGWGTYKTYDLAPPLPQQFLTADGKVVMTEEDIFAGKAGFQKADLMDYGSLYGMGSYFGEDYTAKYLVRLGRLTEDAMSQQQFGKKFAELPDEKQYLVRKAMQHELQQQIDHLRLNDRVTLALQLLHAVITRFPLVMKSLPLFLFGSTAHIFTRRGWNNVRVSSLV